jgi:hypothetical protein
MPSDYLRALREELVGYERAGRTDRAEQVQAEIDRVTGAATKRAEATKRAGVPAQRRSPRKAQG